MDFFFHALSRKDTDCWKMSFFERGSFEVMKERSMKGVYGNNGTLRFSDLFNNTFCQLKSSKMRKVPHFFFLLLHFFKKCDFFFLRKKLCRKNGLHCLSQRALKPL